MAAEASSPSEHMTWSTDEDDDKEEEQQEDEEEQEEEFEAAEGHDDDDLGPPPDEDDDDVEEDKEVHEEKIAHTNSAVPDELQNKEENEGDIMKARKLSFVSTDLSSLPSVIFQGMIMKKADDSKIRFINPWKKRFLVLTSDFLSYSASEQASNNLNELKAIILLKSSFTCDRSVTGCELTIFDNLLTERKKVKVLHLKAFDSTAAQAWYDHITKAILKKTEISSNLASRSSMKFKGSDIKSVLESLSKEIIVQSTEDGSSLEKEQEKAMAKQINRNPDEEKIACIVSRTKFFMKLKDLDDTRKYRSLLSHKALPPLFLFVFLFILLIIILTHHLSFFFLLSPTHTHILCPSYILLLLFLYLCLSLFSSLSQICMNTLTNKHLLLTIFFDFAQ